MGPITSITFLLISMTGIKLSIGGITHEAGHISYHTYKQIENDCGCGVSAVGESDKDYYHARCLCKDVSEKEQCQQLCSDDKHCKGFAMKSETDSASCQLATSQNKCPDGCIHSVESAPSDDNIGALNPEIECHDEGVWMGGCYIKQEFEYTEMTSQACCVSEDKYDLIGGIEKDGVSNDECEDHCSKYDWCVGIRAHDDDDMCRLLTPDDVQLDGWTPTNENHWANPEDWKNCFEEHVQTLKYFCFQKGPKKIHCDWSDYETTPCSQTCGDGTLTKTRTKLIEENEYGFCDMEGEVGTVQRFQETCNEKTCPPVHCIWGPWKLGQCTATCGEGIRVDSREKLIEEEHGGICDGWNIEVKSCTNEEECPIDCQWSEWHNTRCSKSCGEGTWTKKRTSTVKDHACRGTQQFTETCNERPCPINCMWTRWQNGECDCETMIRPRTRTQIPPQYGGRQCQGSSQGTHACHFNECHVPYVRGERGSLCIEQDILKDAKTCEKAAEYFDMTYSGVESSDDAPKGCFYNDIQDAAVFNNHKTGRGEEAAGESTTSPLCKLDPVICPDSCKTACKSPPRKVRGRRNVQTNGYCFHWCAPPKKDHRRGYCGVSGDIKSRGRDCRGCRMFIHGY